MLKKLNKIIEKTKKSLEEQKYAECVASARQMIQHDEKAQSFINKGQSFVCSCSSKGKDTKVAVESCTKVLDNAPNDAEALYNRAQAYITDELLEQGKLDTLTTMDDSSPSLLILVLSSFQLKETAKKPTR